MFVTIALKLIIGGISHTGHQLLGLMKRSLGFATGPRQTHPNLAKATSERLLAQATIVRTLMLFEELA